MSFAKGNNGETLPSATLKNKTFQSFSAQAKTLLLDLEKEPTWWKTIDEDLLCGALQRERKVIVL